MNWNFIIFYFYESLRRILSVIMFIIVSQVVIVPPDVCACHGAEYHFFVLRIFSIQDVMLDQHALVLAFEQGVAVNFPVEVVSELLVGVNELLDSPLALIQVDVLHLVALHKGLEIADLLSEGLLRVDLVSTSTMLVVLLLEVLVLNLQLLNHSLQRLH